MPGGVITAEFNTSSSVIHLLDSGDLIFHLKGSQTPITASPSVKAGHDDVLSAGQVLGPAQPVAVVCLLAARTRVSGAGGVGWSETDVNWLRVYE